MAGTIEKLARLIADQEARNARMIEQNPTSPSIRAGKRMVFVFKAEMECLRAGGVFDAAATNAATAASRQAIK